MKSQDKPIRWRPARILVRLRPRLRRLAGGSLTRRIVFLNLLGLVALLYGILYLNQFQAGLIDARVQSLLVQGEILARAVAGTATVENDVIELDTKSDSRNELDEETFFSPRNFFINPAKTMPVVRRLLQPSRLRTRVYDQGGLLLLDSRFLYSRTQELQQKEKAAREESPVLKIWSFLSHTFSSQDLPRYVEYGTTDGKSYPEVAQALLGKPASIVRIDDKGELIVSVAVPVQRQNQLVGAMLLSTIGGDIDTVLRAERMGIVRIFTVAAVVMILLSILMASTIAGPLKRLAEAAERVRRGTRREQIPDFSYRFDEVGHLSSALRDMTRALYTRIEAIERFAADVAHELKNPLTSMKSAVETLPIVKNDTDRQRLLTIINDDVRRLDRLITDISAASRLDAELQRQNEKIIDLKEMLFSLVAFYEDMRSEDTPPVHLSVKSDSKPQAYSMKGHESRLGQIFSNLIDNALSFSPKNSEVQVQLERNGNKLVVTIDDDGYGIKAEPVERIFERFFTDRPDQDFGTHSGLGLSISKQIVEAHHGTIIAQNRKDAAGKNLGARFVISFPAM
ncbi:MAG: stimulus-sensing domain-containing protein [Pseudomonadota bacterium]